MIEAATRILERAAAGKAESIPAAPENLDLRDRRVDEISAVRVRLLHRDRDHAHRLVEPCLAPRGKLPISFDLPSQGNAPR